MKAHVFALCLSLSLCLGLPLPALAFASPFTDVQETSPYYEKYVIPEGTYDGVPEATTVAVSAVVIARDDVSDKISGLDCGADDYMTKPFDTGELMARVRALTRRQGEVLSDVLTVNDLSLDCTSRLLSAGERSVRLGFKEFEVLRLLMVNNGNVVTKETLISKIWGLDSEAEDNNVEVYISFLRKKLDYLHSKVKIRTIRMVGYRLEQEA